MSMRYQPTGDLNLMALVCAVATERGTTIENARDTVQSVLDVIGRTLAAGHRVSLTNFGSWEPGVRTLGVGAMGRITRETEVNTVLFRTSGRLRNAIHAGEAIGTLKKAPKSY